MMPLIGRGGGRLLNDALKFEYEYEINIIWNEQMTSKMMIEISILTNQER